MGKCWHRFTIKIDFCGSKQFFAILYVQIYTHTYTFLYIDTYLVFYIFIFIYIFYISHMLADRKNKGQENCLSVLKLK